MYSGWPGFRYSENSCSPPSPSTLPNQDDKDAGNNRNVLAKIAGITPDIFSLSGRKLDGA